MVSTLARRPLPALISLVALLVLTGLVWWRVLHRSDSSAGGAETPCPTPTPTVTATAAATLPVPQKVTVQVLNATDRSGIAGRARSTLIADGFKSPQKATNDTNGKVAGVAEIRYGPAGRDAAKLLSYFLPGAKLVPSQSTTATVVVSLGNQYSKVSTLSAVGSALVRDHVTLQSTAPSHSTAPSGTPTGSAGGSSTPASSGSSSNAKC